MVQWVEVCGWLPRKWPSVADDKKLVDVSNILHILATHIAKHNSNDAECLDMD